MQKILMLVVALMAFGCAEQVSVNMDTLIQEGSREVFTDPEKMTLYSGPVFRLDADDPTRVVFRAVLRNGEYHGPFTDYDPTDVGVSEVNYEGIYEEGEYRDGLREGPYTLFYPSGIIRGEGSYRSGLLDGPYTRWNENGQGRMERSYSNGEPEGPPTFWSENGQLYRSIQEQLLHESGYYQQREFEFLSCTNLSTEAPVADVRVCADQGDAQAQFYLGNMYAIGLRVPENHSEASRLIQLAADQGHAEAQTSLGIMYNNGDLLYAEDDVEAVRWFRLAADQGHARAQSNLGAMYDNGHGVSEDDVEAVRWFRLAADQGYAEAQFNLGVMYDNGHGVSEDDVEAVRWFRLAADQGYALAQFNLGNRYYRGDGVTKDDVKAYMWWDLSASQGDANAREYKSRVGNLMTPEEIAEAQRMTREWAREWVASHPPEGGDSAMDSLIVGYFVGTVVAHMGFIFLLSLPVRAFVGWLMDPQMREKTATVHTSGSGYIIKRLVIISVASFVSFYLSLDQRLEDPFSDPRYGQVLVENLWAALLFFFVSLAWNWTWHAPDLQKKPSKARERSQSANE